MRQDNHLRHRGRRQTMPPLNGRQPVAEDVQLTCDRDLSAKWILDRSVLFLLSVAAVSPMLHRWLYAAAHRPYARRRVQCIF
jgi:hypothetical protein